jgi:hypothetical protein
MHAIRPCGCSLLPASNTRLTWHAACSAANKVAMAAMKQAISSAMKITENLMPGNHTIRLIFEGLKVPKTELHS